MKKNKRHIYYLGLLLLICFDANAKIILPAFFSDNMVLQQKTKVAIWGEADKKANITIITSWNKKKYTTQADANGKWKLSIVTEKAGGPYTIQIQEKETLQLNNVMLGEVWFCSGQSNMEMPMRGFKNQPVLHSNEILLDADNDQLRLFETKRNASNQPQKNVEGQWNISDASTAREFSAVAFMYGMMLQKKLHVPVGIIVSCWGGTRIQSWMDSSMLQSYPDINQISKIDTAKEKHKFVTTLYNGMIAPFAGYGLRGFLWYQGESNRHEPERYASLLQTMVAGWRKNWNAGDSLPFYYVQIAPYGNKDTTRSVRGIREAQMKSMNRIANCGMAVTMDIGNEDQIHPADKKTVSERLLYWALAKTYGYKGIAYCGPIYKSHQINNKKVNISFDYAEGGLSSFGADLKQFEIAGADKVFVPAMAKIEDNKTITVWSESVNEPVAVRYAYKDYVKGDLYNTDGLPASSFRTDEW